MNLTDDDDYWNESRISKFSFEQDENKGDDVFLLEDAIDNHSSRNENETAYLTNTSLSLDHNIHIETVKNYFSEHAINCILEYDSDRNELSAFRKLPADEEIRLLRRQIKERWSSPSIEDTINRILLGQQYSFELYKSLSSKKSLLKCAVESTDGDAILAVVVYLAKTLKKSLFYHLLTDYPVAVSHYTYYLYVRRQMSELTDLLEALGKPTEAMIKQLTIASQNPHRIQQRLSSLLKNFSFDTWHRQTVENYLKLIEWQCVASKQTGDPSIVGASAVQTLEYNYLRKLNVHLPDDIKSEGQPMDLAKRFGLSDKLSLTVMIRVNSELKKWNDIQPLLVAKSWVGSKKLNTNLPIDKLLNDLQKCGAPATLLDNILILIVDNEKRVEMASKLGRHIVAIDTLKKKDKTALLQYMAILDSQSFEYKYAEEALQTMGSRWKK